jgi:hypothetical protein
MRTVDGQSTRECHPDREVEQVSRQQSWGNPTEDRVRDRGGDDRRYRQQTHDGCTSAPRIGNEDSVRDDQREPNETLPAGHQHHTKAIGGDMAENLAGTPRDTDAPDLGQGQGREAHHLNSSKLPQ